MTHYIVSNRNYEYNDEGYDMSEGGTPVYVTTSREDANAWIEKAIVSDARRGKFYILEGMYINSDNIERYIGIFGEKDIHVSEYNSRKFARIERVPDMSGWCEDSIHEYMELVNLNLYFVTEVEN